MALVALAIDLRSSFRVTNLIRYPDADLLRL